MRDSGFGMGKDARAALRFSRTRPSGIRPGVDARPSRRSAFPNPESRIPAFNSRTAGHPRPMRQAHFVARHEREWMRAEEHTSELQSLMRLSYAVSCLKNK